MNLIIALFFRTPFWVQFIAAAGLVWLGWTVQQQDVARAAARAELLQQAPPATIPITAFSSDAPSKTPVELSVTAQVALDHNTRLVRKTNFVKTGEDLFYVLVDPTVGADINLALAGIIIDPDQLDAFTAWMMENATDFGAAGPIVTISGLRTSEGNASHAYDAMKNQGMTKSPDFFFIEPFIAGREATLAALPTETVQASWVLYGIAGLLALIGVKKLKSARQPKAGPMRPVSANPALANPMTTGRAMAQYDTAVSQAAANVPTKKPASQLKSPMSKGKIAMLGLGAVLIGGLLTNQSWAYAMLPLGFFGLVFLGLRNGLRSVTQQVGTVIDSISSKAGSSKSGSATPGNSWSGLAKAPVPDTHAPLAASPFAPAATKLASKDSGPIRPGFSFKDLLPKPRPKAALGPDPFERLAQQRLRQEGGPIGR